MSALNQKDDKFEELVWESLVPIKIEMAMCDMSTSNVPLTLYYNVPRIGYLTSLFEKIMTSLKNFDSSIPTNLPEFWIEYKNIPIRWQYPIGVIIDSLKINIEEGPVPFYVHIRKLPDDVLQYESHLLSTYYTKCLKEANNIKYPKDNKALQIPTDKTNTLISIVYLNDSKNLKEFRGIMDFINENGLKPIEKYPVKIIFCRLKFVVSKPAKVEDEDPFKLTMKDYFINSFGEEVYLKLREKCDIIVHGIIVEEDMPFLFYYLNFCYMDNFLYICFTEK